MGLCKLILRHVLISNRCGLRLNLINEALVVDLNWQHFWILVCIERVLVDELLLRRS